LKITDSPCAMSEQEVHNLWFFRFFLFCDLRLMCHIA